MTALKNCRNHRLDFPVVSCLPYSVRRFGETYKGCSKKKDRTFAINTLLLILHHFKQCPLQSSALYWRYTVTKVSFIGSSSIDRVTKTRNRISFLAVQVIFICVYITNHLHLLTVFLSF
jgi:hypothetical protein